MGTVGAAMQYMHNHPGNFGHTAQRFKEKPTGSHLGPGQYLSQNRQAKAAEKYLPKLSAAFRGSHRTNLNINKEALSNPSAVDYAKDQAESNFVKGRNEGSRHPFGNNETRWP